MKIGYDISQISFNPAGCGQYADIFYRKLRLNNEINIRGYRSFGGLYYDKSFNLSRKHKIDNFFSVNDFCHNTHAKCLSFWNKETFDKKKYKQLGSPDIVHSNNFFFPPTSNYCKTVYTLYDLSFYANPSWTSEANWSVCSNGLFDASYKADHIVTISEFSKNSFLELFPNFDQKNISVVYPTSRFEGYTVNASFKGIKALINKDFFISVGTLEPRKNHIAILGAYCDFVKNFRGVPPLLVLVGGKGWLFKKTIDFITENNLGNYIIFTNYVSDDELFWLYKNCILNIYFSFYEGFGMPILESLSANALTVTSAIEPFAELFGSAVIRAEGNERTFLADLLNLVVKSPNQFSHLKNDNLAIKRRFDLDTNIEKLLNIYKKLSK
jgi:glycosyltransferase involved in cell wall biosynthesis